MSLTKNTRVIAGDEGWLEDLTEIVTGVTVNNGGTIQRDPILGQTGLAATPLKHQGRIGFARMFYGSKSRTLADYTNGYIFVMATDVDGWEGGQFSDPSNTLTNPTGGLILRGVAMAQAGAWHDAGPLAARDRITTVDLDNSNTDITGINAHMGDDNFYLLLSTSAVCMVRLEQGSNMADQVSLTTDATIVALPKNGLGDSAVTDLELTTTGLGAGEDLDGWLLAGPEMGID